MMKTSLLMTFLVAACAVDTDPETSESLGASEVCSCDCPENCETEPECPPDPPPPSGPTCTDKGVVVNLDQAPANVDNTDGKVTYCHATSSAKNPYVVITTSVNACFAHVSHVHQIKGGHRDVFPTGGCAD